MLKNGFFVVINLSSVLNHRSLIFAAKFQDAHKSLIELSISTYILMDPSV